MVKSFAPQAYGQPPLTNQSADDLRQMMIDVVEHGTGTAARINGLTVAGKTGTATNGPGKPPNAWFVSFAPAGGAKTATIAVAVIVLDGGDLGNEATGGRVAAPIAAKVICAYLDRCPG